MGSTTNNTLSTNRPIIPTTKQLLYIDVIVVKSLQKRLEGIEDRKVPLVALPIRIAQRLHGIENAHVHILSRNDSLQHALTRQITAPIVREILHSEPSSTQTMRHVEKSHIGSSHLYSFM